MKRTTSTESAHTQTTGPNRKHKLIRAAALTAAILVGTATTMLAVVPAARAFAAHSDMHDHDSFFASMHGGHSPEQMHAHFDKVLSEAGVSDDQKQQIHGLMKDAMVAEHADMQRFHDSCAQLKTLLTADPIDDAAIQKVRDEQDQLMLATSHRLSDTLIAVAKVLTPEQRSKLGAEIDRMMAQHGMHHHGG
jgi:Spy/CpxP family protein refolding chaperone